MKVDIPEPGVDRTHRIGKKTPDRVIPIIVHFTTMRHHTMVHNKRKDRVNCRITLDLTKSCMDIAIDLAWESDHISYSFADISCGLCIKLFNASFKFFNTIDDLSNLWGLILIFYVCFNLRISWILRFLEFIFIFQHFVRLCSCLLKLFYLFLTFLLHFSLVTLFSELSM